MEERFWKAARDGNMSEVKEILRGNPSLDVNWRNEKEFGFTPLHLASRNGHASIVAILLAHPAIDVNQKTNVGDTPSMWACVNGSTASVRVLLKDSRVKVDERNSSGHTPLRWAAYNGHIEIIKWWIASGREMDLGQPGNYYTDASGQAREKGETEVATLLEKFKENQTETRNGVRNQLGIKG